MSEKKQEFHGSDLEKVEAYYGIKKEDIIPFAGNVNLLLKYVIVLQDRM